ncbi:ABC transporter permease [Streptomyces rubellomurinus]|uniref:ABC transporter permease n=1 Tax=Streptomyces rubellomurinus (strain ATCC 31215) TaxID=359131 RepID=UPI000A8C81AD|nr:ABC transporter permease [Streptomyces rubellomurinus]
MRSAWTRYRIATGYALVEHLRNRLALALVVFFIPIWITLVYLVITNAPVPFLLRASDQVITVDGNHISKISGAVNAVTLIVGFMMFIATYRSAHFDQRVAMAGYPRAHVLAAKLSSLLLAAALICAYAVAVICCYWVPDQPVMLWLSLFGAALAFGGLGVMLGVALRGELEGMFLIIMLSLIDMGLQNPVANPASGNGIVRFLPSYGAMQAGVTSGFLPTAPGLHLLLGPMWLLGSALVASATFRLRTRDRRHTRHTILPRPSARGSVQEDGESAGAGPEEAARRGGGGGSGQTRA